MTEAGNAGKKFDELVGILEALRGPGGCPWDRARTALDIRDYFLEEVYEAVEALEEGDAANLAEELGDVLMEVVFLSRIHEEMGAFTVADALDRVNAKMVARHPHVFGSPRDMTTAGVADAWQEGKRAEKGASSILEDPGPTTPALLSAFQIGRRASAYGFDWPGVAGVLAKVREETGELETAVSEADADGIEEELGDLMFSLANAARKLGVNPELALRKANAKFVRRFRALEDELRSSGKDLGKMSLEEMDAIWNRQKARDQG
ncbi:MAG TPA: nucleoside triphosphate pyrophosphohydrolase [Acidobacteriota bacterium]|nr:nucleoside triphosphate pyrophosphohydrolase [Acidobacteriota bacterium]